MCFSFTKITTKKTFFLGDKRNRSYSTEFRSAGAFKTIPVTVRRRVSAGKFSKIFSRERVCPSVVFAKPYPVSYSPPYLLSLSITSVFTANHSQDDPRLLSAFPLSISVRFSDCRKQVSCYRKAVFPLPRKTKPTTETFHLKDVDFNQLERWRCCCFITTWKTSAASARPYLLPLLILVFQLSAHLSLLH